MSKHKRRPQGRHPSVIPMKRPQQPATAKPAAASDRKKLTKEQFLAVQLMQARNLIQKKNAVIAQLEGQVATLKAEVLQHAINAEQRENVLLAREYGLPEGDFQLQVENGEYFVTTAAPQAKQAQAEAQAATKKELQEQKPTDVDPELAEEATDEEEAESDEESYSEEEAEVGAEA